MDFAENLTTKKKLLE